ncbi:MAG: hypothetical protein R2798_12050 [Chitinophagales bacterium]|nr:hypothetical protein [Chitinophagales bacterium]
MEEMENEIRKSFGKSSDEVIRKFKDYSNGDEWVSHEKVLKAILKLSQGNIEKVDKYLKMARLDPRDVVMIADES